MTDRRVPSRSVVTTGRTWDLPRTPEEAFEALQEARRAFAAIPPVLTRIDAPTTVLDELRRVLPATATPGTHAIELCADNALPHRSVRLHRSDGSEEVIRL